MSMGLSRCKLRDYQQKRLLEYYVLEVTARAAANMLQIHPNCAALFYTKVRILIAQQLALDALQMFDGSIELDESYFGGVRKGKGGRGAAGKVVVFGILKRGGRVYTQVVEDTKTETLMGQIRAKVMPDSVVYTNFVSQLSGTGCERVCASSHQSQYACCQGQKSHQWH